MSKKLFIPIAAASAIAIFAGLWASSTVLAKNPDILGRFRKPRAVLGQVIRIAADEFTILKRDGEEASFLVGENTQFRDREGNQLAFNDLAEDGWVAVLAPRGDQAHPAARLVIILADDFDPEKMVGAGGVVLGVDQDSNKLTLRNRLGEELEFNLGAETIFKGQALDLASLEEGMWARITSEKLDSGGLLADLVRSTYPIRRILGEITAVDEGAGTFTLHSRRSQEEVTVMVDENTRFRSRSESVAGLADLQPGMYALVIAKNPQGATENNAVFVAASLPEDLPKSGKRVLGEVISLNTDSITVEARDGQQYTFMVDENTRFRSRDRQLNRLEDLQKGMIVFVAGKDNSDGTYQALLIASPQRLQP